jgi:hypothetical protein
MGSPPKFPTVFLTRSGKSGATVASGANVKMSDCPAWAASLKIVSQNFFAGE